MNSLRLEFTREIFDPESTYQPLQELGQKIAWLKRRME
jgi:hypothetical protein